MRSLPFLPIIEELNIVISKLNLLFLCLFLVNFWDVLFYNIYIYMLITVKISLLFFFCLLYLIVNFIYFFLLFVYLQIYWSCLGGFRTDRRLTASLIIFVWKICECVAKRSKCCCQFSSNILELPAATNLPWVTVSILEKVNGICFVLNCFHANEKNASIVFFPLIHFFLLCFCYGDWMDSAKRWRLNGLCKAMEGMTNSIHAYHLAPYVQLLKS